MADSVSPEVRSKMMSGIRGKDTKPEIQVRRYLHALGFRYSLHRRDLPGHPDLVLSKHRAVVFVHGCFWHAHPNCRYATTPSTRREFWSAKLTANRARDQAAISLLLSQSWRVAVVWECALRRSPKAALDELSKLLRSDQRYGEISWNQEPKTE